MSKSAQESTNGKSAYGAESITVLEGLEAVRVLAPSVVLEHQLCAEAALALGHPLVPLKAFGVDEATHAQR